MDDDAFVQAFEAAALSNAEFHHRDHLRLTWLYLRRHGAGPGAERVRSGIRRFAAAHGAADRYHETLTTFWVRLVDHVMTAAPDVRRFEDLFAVFPPLGDKTIVYRHYSGELLAQPAARASWVAPDLLPLP